VRNQAFLANPEVAKMKGTGGVGFSRFFLQEEFVIGQKIEPRLLEELRRLEAAGHVRDSIPVIIQINPESRWQEAATYEGLRQRLRENREVILDRLARSGFSDRIRENVLAGSLETQLTRDQITAVAELAPVKRVILNRADQVACAGNQ